MTQKEQDSLKGETLDLRKMSTQNVGQNQMEILFQVEQDWMMLKNPIKLSVLYSLFERSLCTEHLPAPLWIRYTDNQGRILSQMSKASYHSFTLTAKHPIGTKMTRFVQAAYTLPANYILERMKYALILSSLLVCFIAYIIYYMSDKLWQKDKMLKQEEENIHNMVHDLKSPLNAIYTLLESVSEKNMNEMEHGIMERGKSRILRLNDQIEFVLNSTKEGNFEIKESDIDLPVMLEHIWNEVKDLYHNKECHLILSNPERITQIHSDAVRLERCFTNLLDNALKYADNDVHVSVIWTKKQENLQIKIADNGWGIEQKYIKRIGQPFFRVKQVDKPTVKGYGLGLNSVKKLLHDINGKLYIDSHIGQGSTFTIIIPY